MREHDAVPAEVVRRTEERRDVRETRGDDVVRLHPQRRTVDAEDALIGSDLLQLGDRKARRQSARKLPIGGQWRLGAAARRLDRLTSVIESDFVVKDDAE